MCLGSFRSDGDEYLLEFARDDIQLLVNELWKVQWRLTHGFSDFHVVL